jgi:hypothetical protein
VSAVVEQDSLAGQVLAAHRPHGVRLGIAVVPGIPGSVLDAATQALLESGVDPIRRLAHLRPRPDEPTTRPEDVAYFVERFGHEYTVLVCPSDLTGPRARLEEVCSTAGCALVVT